MLSILTTLWIWACHSRFEGLSSWFSRLRSPWHAWWEGRSCPSWRGHALFWSRLILGSIQRLVFWLHRHLFWASSPTLSHDYPRVTGVESDSLPIAVQPQLCDGCVDLQRTFHFRSECLPEPSWQSRGGADSHTRSQTYALTLSPGSRVRT